MHSTIDRYISRALAVLLVAALSALLGCVLFTLGYYFPAMNWVALTLAGGGGVAICSAVSVAATLQIVKNQKNASF